MGQDWVSVCMRAWRGSYFLLHADFFFFTTSSNSGITRSSKLNFVKIGSTDETDEDEEMDDADEVERVGAICDGAYWGVGATTASGGVGGCVLGGEGGFCEYATPRAYFDGDGGSGLTGLDDLTKDGMGLLYVVQTFERGTDHGRRECRWKGMRPFDWSEESYLERTIRHMRATVRSTPQRTSGTPMPTRPFQFVTPHPTGWPNAPLRGECGPCLARRRLILLTAPSTSPTGDNFTAGGLMH
ncbi:hypothetical protein EI94DRAFT_1786215 [Lactarius quietus]|nr:hypothetical protein EI94DRAFT_1786215 [Lactarius quietus]